jgi:hypothetical protein
MLGPSWSLEASWLRLCLQPHLLLFLHNLSSTNHMWFSQIGQFSKISHLAIFRQLLPSLEQSSSSRCSKVTYRGSGIGRDLFSSCIVDVWFPIRPASWRPWRESFVCIRRVFGHRSWLASGGAASRPILRVIALIGRYVVAPPLLSYPPVKIIPTLHRLEV